MDFFEVKCGGLNCFDSAVGKVQTAFWSTDQIKLFIQGGCDSIGRDLLTPTESVR